MGTHGFEMMSGRLRMKNIKLVVINDGISEGESDNAKVEAQVWPMVGLSIGSFIQLI